MAVLPYYFYNLNAQMPDGTQRWVDEFASRDSSIVLPHEMNVKWLRARHVRNVMYSAWMASFCDVDKDGNMQLFISPKQMKWQAIRVLKFKHSERNNKDWWENYQDAVFRVFVQPQTFYEGDDHKQWYILCPEDCYLVNRHEIERKGTILPPRDRHQERWLSNDSRLRMCRCIPVECCHHLRNETTGGVLPGEL